MPTCVGANLQLVVFSAFVLVLLFDSGSVNTARLQELGETFQSPFAVVIDDFVVSLLEQLDGGESLNLDVLELVGSRVHLGNDDVFVVLELLTQFVPSGSQLFAVS